MVRINGLLKKSVDQAEGGREPSGHKTHFSYLLCRKFPILSFFFFFIFLFVVNFVIHWNETVMGLHVFPIPIPPPTSLSTRSP